MTKQEYNKEYYKKHKKEMLENREKWLENNPNWKKEYYEKNKEKILKNNKEWQKNNKKQFIKLCQASRQRRVDRLKAEGCSNPWAVVSNGATPKYKK